jgi:RND family efflux transporter MFP subunit
MKKAILLLTIIVLVASCNSDTDKKAQLEKLRAQRDKLNEQIQKLEKEVLAGDPSTAKLKDVDAEAVKLSEFRHYVEIQGKVDGDENIALSAKAPGFVTEINVDEGQQVVKGQLLATLDDLVLQQGLKELESSLDYATDLYNRQKNLWDQNIGSEVQYLTAKNTKESLENKIKTMKEQMSLLKITSPIDGTVEEVPIKVGQYVSPGLSIFRIVNFSHVKVTGEVAEAYSPKVKRGDSVIIFFPDFNKEIKSSLTFSSKFINPANRTFQIECHFDPGDNEFRANMISVIRILDYKSDSAVVVPVNVIQKSISEIYVFVARDENGKKIARKQIITTGSTYNGLTEVLSGLKKGDQLITTGYQELNDGQPVNYK